MKKRVFLGIVMGVIALSALTIAFLNVALRGGTLAVGASRTPSEGIPSGASLPIAPPPSPLAFSSDRDGNWDIFILSPQGTLTNLTADSTQAHDYFPSFALDGGQINFIASRGTADEGLVPSQVKPDGSDLRTLSIVEAVFTLVREGRFDWDPSWSPDGTRLLWSSLRDFNLELYTIATDGEFLVSNATRLTQAPARDWFGSWSPDGTRVAFASDRDGNENLYVVDANLPQSARALTDSPFDDIHAMWSLDGGLIAYVHDQDDVALLNGNVLIYTLSPEDNATPTPLSGVFIGDPVYSPDGTQVAYVSNETGEWHIYLMNADGSNRRRVTEDGANYLFPVWQP